jgi:hypothetical protein
MSPASSMNDSVKKSTQDNHIPSVLSYLHNPQLSNQTFPPQPFHSTMSNNAAAQGANAAVYVFAPPCVPLSLRLILTGMSQNSAQPLWPVKAIEGKKTLIIQGVPQTFYLVRWRGNWPPSQNPTWERRENIPEELRQEYDEEVSRTIDPDFDLKKPAV